METQEYLQRQRELLNRLTQINSEDYKTKKEIIQSLIDVTRPLMEAGYYNWKRVYFASYIHQQLLDYNIEYPRGETFYNLFHDEEKREERTNSESLSEIHQHKFNDDNECECGVIKHKDILYDVAQITIDKTDLESNVKTDEKPDPFQNKFTEYIQRVKINCDEFASQCNDIIKKYYDNEEIAKAIEKAIPGINPLLDEQKGLEAHLLHMGKQSDYRQKIGEFEKVKSIILCSTYNLAKVAKILTITPKHQSHNILSNLDKYLENMKWFRSLFFECDKCKFENEIELYDWYNEQIERKTLGLDQIDIT